ncbi:MAG: glycosyltransferase [Burkholderiaceae bacterium]|jgi:glycosyltransferase involved in cell wall biosynthesis|nr:glycosyltransferase [Burkholderiaceae bacterium]
MPTVSVLLTSYNHAPFLREAIESVLSQTFSDFELIIWDDASVDASWEIICSYDDPRVRAFRSQTNSGGMAFRHVFADEAVGQYVAMHHSDDAWEPDKLAKQVAYLSAHPECAAVFTYAKGIDERGVPFEGETVFEQPNRSQAAWLRHLLEQGNCLCHPSMLARRVVYETGGGARLGFAQLGDFDMWLRLLLRFPIHVLPEKLVRFRMLDNQRNASALRQDSLYRMPFEHAQLLGVFESVTDNAFFFAMYPELESVYASEHLFPQYLWAMLCIEKDFYGVGAWYGCNLLFRLLNDPVWGKKMVLADQQCNATFTALIGSVDTTLRPALADSEARLAACQAQVEALSSELGQHYIQLAGVYGRLIRTP